MKIKVNFEVEIKNIEVNDGYYSFDYIVKTGNKILTEETYDSDFDNGMSDSRWKKELENGEALNIALQQFAENYEN